MTLSRILEDSVITTKVKAGLIKEEGLRALRVGVETSNGIVHLRGMVTSYSEIANASHIALHTDGVKWVHNSLTRKH